MTDDEIAARYRQLLMRHVGLRRSAANQHVRAAAAALYQAGVHRHKLLLLHQIMARFENRRGAADPTLAFAGQLHAQLSEPPLEAAARHYRLAITLVPRFAEALYNLATLRRETGACAEAAALLRRAADAPSWPGANRYAQVPAEALWNLARRERAEGRRRRAVMLHRRALRALDNFGVHHVEFADLLREDGRAAAAAIEYERLMPYSHRYTPEFFEPDFTAAERPPLDARGMPCSPLVPAPVGTTEDGAIWYWWHLYFHVPFGEMLRASEDFERALGPPRRRLRWPWQPRDAGTGPVRVGTSHALLAQCRTG